MQWQRTPVFLHREFRGQRSLVASVHGVAQSQTRLKRLSVHACIGEGIGNLLQYSCLENPRDRGAWWAAIYGVTQSQTPLKRLSSSSSDAMRYGMEGFPLSWCILCLCPGCELHKCFSVFFSFTWWSRVTRAGCSWILPSLRSIRLWVTSFPWGHVLVYFKLVPLPSLS